MAVGKLFILPGFGRRFFVLAGREQITTSGLFEVRIAQPQAVHKVKIRTKWRKGIRRTGDKYSKYNILTIDVIGHGKSTKVRKGDSIDKMSSWISKILKTEKVEKVHIVGISLGAVLAQDFANQYPEAVQSLACFGGYDINNFDAKMQKENSTSQLLMMFKAIFSIKWFAKSNKKISAYTLQAQKDFYEMNIHFSKKSFMYLASLKSMINVRQATPRKYPLLIGCGKYDIPMELSAVEMWKKNEPESDVIIFEEAGHCVNMDTPNKFNAVMEEFWLSGSCKY